MRVSWQENGRGVSTYRTGTVQQYLTTGVDNNRVEAVIHDEERRMLVVMPMAHLTVLKGVNA